mmetsp:Transcript_58865/g.65849  ORF Transcript_58865/g.65849 Transcript_58865/m.65849 type:complete len:107 (-) Transcript_58865:543-863(-)
MIDTTIVGVQEKLIHHAQPSRLSWSMYVAINQTNLVAYAKQLISMGPTALQIRYNLLLQSVDGIKIKIHLKVISMDKMTIKILIPYNKIVVLSCMIEIDSWIGACG